MALQFNYVYKSFEIRDCPQRLVRFSPDDKSETIQLIKWTTDINDEHFCFTIAYFVRTKEGYELKFVGDRPFRYINEDDIKTLWSILRVAQKVLNDYFKRGLEND